jgi:hypothetical protein
MRDHNFTTTYVTPLLIATHPDFICYASASVDSELNMRIQRAHKKIRLIESNAKCRYLKKLACKMILRQVFICLRPHPFLVFLFGVVWQFCTGSELVRYRVLNSCRIWSPTQLNSPSPPPSHTLSVYQWYTIF